MPAKKSSATVASKMFIKGGTALVLGTAPAGASKLLAPATVTTSTSGPVETVVVFLDALGHLAPLVKKAKAHLGPSSRLWIAYQKGDPALHRDTLWDAMEPRGFEGSRLISFDDVWSVMMFRAA